jgi:hypothetical protein
VPILLIVYCINLELLLPNEKNRIKTKDIFTHPWVKGFEEARTKKINRSPERGLRNDIQRSPERMLKTLKDQKSPDITLNVQRSPERVVRTVKEQHSPELDNKNQKSPSKIKEINLPLKRDNQKEKSPLKISQEMQPVRKKRSENLIIERKIQMDNDAKRENSAGPTEILQMRKKLNHQSTFTNSRNSNLNQNLEQDCMFDSVLNKVYGKNKGKKKSQNKHIDVDSIIQKELNNSNIMNSSLDYPEKNRLISYKNELERQLQEEDNKIKKNNSKLMGLKQENEQMESYRGSGYKGIESDEDYQAHYVHKMNKDYYPKGKNVELDRSYQQPEKLSTLPHSVYTIDSLNDEIYINRDTNRSSKYNRKSGVKNFVSEITRQYLFNNHRNDNKFSGAQIEDKGKNKRDLLRALEMLEKANETKAEIYVDEKPEKGFWSYLNPFKCGK